MKTIEQQKKERLAFAEVACNLLAKENKKELNDSKFIELIDKSHDGHQRLTREELVEVNERKNFNTIYNFLIQRREDTSLMRSIANNIPKGASIKGSLEYANTKARKIFSTASCAMVDDYTVFMWIREYFISFVPPELRPITFYPKIKNTNKHESRKEKSKTTSPSPKVEFEEITLF